MLSNKPYLVRAFYEWIVDSACTPFIIINSIYPHCKVPQQHVDENGQITLNISPEAVRDLKITNDFVEFRASFSGIVNYISAPIKSVLAVYAQENGQGMFFDFEDEEENAGSVENGWDAVDAPQQIEKSKNDQEKKRPSYLKLVD